MRSPWASCSDVGEVSLGGLSLHTRSQEWEETLDPRKSQLYENKDNGEFWYLPSLKTFEGFIAQAPSSQLLALNFCEHGNQCCSHSE